MLKFKEIDIQKLPLKKMVILGQFIVILFFIRSCHLKDLAINKDGIKIDMYEDKVENYKAKVTGLEDSVVKHKKEVALVKNALQTVQETNTRLAELHRQERIMASNRMSAMFLDLTQTKVTTRKHNDDQDNDMGYGQGEGGGSDNDLDFTSLKDSIPSDTVTHTSLDNNKIDTSEFKTTFRLNIEEKRVKGVKGWLFGKRELKVNVIDCSPDLSIDVISNTPFKHRLSVLVLKISGAGAKNKIFNINEHR